jgi:hypothetical protein
MRERFQDNEPESIDLDYFAYCVFPAFSEWIRRKVREEQGGICDCGCGQKPQKLEVHHRVPQSLGGADNEFNAVGLAPTCHHAWDDKALKEGVIYPGIPIKRAPDSLFRKGAHR